MSGTLDWVGIQGRNLVNICNVSGAINAHGQVSGCWSYGFEKALTERVPLKVLYFYILLHFTLIRGLGAIKGDIREIGESTHLVSYL